MKQIHKEQVMSSTGLSSLVMLLIGSIKLLYINRIAIHLKKKRRNRYDFLNYPKQDNDIYTSNLEVSRMKEMKVEMKTLPKSLEILSQDGWNKNIKRIIQTNY